MDVVKTLLEVEVKRQAICQQCPEFSTTRPDWCNLDNDCAHCKWTDQSKTCPKGNW